jgi:hypothetical protein
MILSLSFALMSACPGLAQGPEPAIACAPPSISLAEAAPLSRAQFHLHAKKTFE